MRGLSRPYPQLGADGRMVRGRENRAGRDGRTRRRILGRPTKKWTPVFRQNIAKSANHTSVAIQSHRNGRRGRDPLQAEKASKRVAEPEAIVGEPTIGI